MAQSSHVLLQHLSGTIGKQLVFKRYGDKTVVTKYPNMKEIQPSERQKENRQSFAEGVAYAKAIARNPQTKAIYQTKVKKGQSVYHYALQEFSRVRKEKTQE